MNATVLIAVLGVVVVIAVVLLILALVLLPRARDRKRERQRVWELQNGTTFNPQREDGGLVNLDYEVDGPGDSTRLR